MTPTADLQSQIDLAFKDYTFWDIGSIWHRMHDFSVVRQCSDVVDQDWSGVVNEWSKDNFPICWSMVCFR
jgi:hypothetical protein